MKLRLAPDAQEVLSAAVVVARKRKHIEVTREHLLGVLLDLEALWPTVLPMRFYRREAAALVAGRLAELPSTGGYRDASIVVPLSEPIRRILAKESRGLVLSHRITAKDLLDALLDEPEIANLLAEAQRDLEALESTIQEATEIATERQHVALRPEHLFRVLVEQRWLARAIHAVGADVDVLRSQLDVRLDSLATLTKGREILPTKALGQLIERTHAYGRKHGTHTASDVFLIFALQHAEMREVFVEAGIPPGQLLSMLYGDPNGAMRPSATTEDPEEIEVTP